MSREYLVNTIIGNVWNEVSGGHINAIMDKLSATMPSDEDIIDEVYQEVIRTKALATRGGFIPVEKDIRFLGTENILNMIRAFHNINKDW